MFYQAKNINVSVDNNQIVATDLQLNYEASISPYYTIGDRNTDTISPDNTIQGSLSFTYYLTGLDPIKNLLGKDQPVKFDVGGINQTGYIKSYNARFIPHNPITCTAEIVFFRSPIGQFSPVYDNNDYSNNIAHVNDILIFNYNNSNLTGSYISANYGYTVDIRPEIHLEDDIEQRGVFGPQETNLSIICDNLNPLLSISGEKAGITLLTKLFSQQTIAEAYSITGFLTRKSFSARTDENLVNEIFIRQYDIGLVPKIFGFQPTSGTFLDNVTISGENFSALTTVFFGETPVVNFTIINDGLISAIVPRIKNTFDVRVGVV